MCAEWDANRLQVEGKYAVVVDRLLAPTATAEGAMLAAPRAKLDVVESIVRLPTGQRGILFLRSTRILVATLEWLRKVGLEIFIVHAERTTSDNAAAPGGISVPPATACC